MTRHGHRPYMAKPISNVRSGLFLRSLHCGSIEVMLGFSCHHSCESLKTMGHWYIYLYTFS